VNLLPVIHPAGKAVPRLLEVFPIPVRQVPRAQVLLALVRLEKVWLKGPAALREQAQRVEAKLPPPVQVVLVLQLLGRGLP
jgi:hypothetical protein